MLVPESAQNLEKGLIAFPDEEDIALDTLEDRRSPGRMLEDSGKKVEEQAKSFGEGRKAMSPGKLEKLQTGNFIVYVTAHAVKEVIQSERLPLFPRRNTTSLFTDTNQSRIIVSVCIGNQFMSKAALKS